MITSMSRIMFSNGRWLVSEKNSNDYEPLKGVVMQFTGLLDKSGKEIYEGDILRRSKDGERYHFIVKVHFSGGAFCATTYPPARNGPYTWNLQTAMDTEGAEYDEVIGNTYENPELLKP